MILGVIDACWHPSGVRSSLDRKLGVPLCSPPGYWLSSLWDEKRVQSGFIPTGTHSGYLLSSLWDEKPSFKGEPS